MTREQRKALAAVATPEAPEDRVARVRTNLERWGVLGVVDDAARRHGVEVDDVLSRSQTHAALAARHDVWRRLYREDLWGCSQLAAVFEAEHTTVQTALSSRGEVPG